MPGRTAPGYSPAPGRPKPGSRSFSNVGQGREDPILRLTRGSAGRKLQKVSLKQPGTPGHRSTRPEVGEASRSGRSSPLIPTFALGATSLDVLGVHLCRTFVSQAPMTGAWDQCPTPSGGRPLPTSFGKQGNERSGHPAEHLT